CRLRGRARDRPVVPDAVHRARPRRDGARPHRARARDRDRARGARRADERSLVGFPPRWVRLIVSGMASQRGHGAMMRTFLIAAVSAAVTVAIVDGQPPAVFRSGIEVVELDVSVTRGGVPMQGLTARDFGLTDNGVAQDIESVMLDRLPLS